MAYTVEQLSNLLLKGPVLTSAAVGQLFRGFCARCRGHGRAPHHLIPVSLGGTWQARNVVWTCGTCHEWMQEDALAKAVEIRAMADDLLDAVGTLTEGMR